MRMKMKVEVLSLLPVAAAVLLCLCGSPTVEAHDLATKECTNLPTQLAAHSFRYDLMTSNNATWKAEVLSQFHATPNDESTWSKMRPKALSKQEDQHDWDMVYRKIKNTGLYAPPQDILKEVSLHDVRLHLDSHHFRAQHTNLEYLLMFDVDSLLWSFRKTAGLPTPGTPYGGWEAPHVELRGHYVGHYMSATARMWASTHNEVVKEKMSAVVGNLSLCQQKIGTGYLSAFPTEQFDQFEALRFVWAPYYTIHKIMAGLLDQYTIGENPEALKMVTWMADYFHDRVMNVIKLYTLERHYTSLNEEVGGMNDVLYNIYNLTGNTKYLMLAHLFDKPCFLGLLGVEANNIADLHSNTHIPLVVGSQMRYEFTGDPLYKQIATYFLDVINSSHSYATGGTSVHEFWRQPKRMADVLQTENEESCTTYNLLKVTRNLFRWTKDISYADYYERALTNGVLSIQRGKQPGTMIYMLPQGHGVSKAKSGRGWGTPFNSFWCCYGTGSESFSKLGDSIYFEEQGSDPTLYIIQFISSTFNWARGQMVLNQTVEPINSWDPFLRVTYTFSPHTGDATSSTLKVRVPSWTQLNGLKAMLNSDSLPVIAPGTYLSVTHKWTSSDKLVLQIPITLRTEQVKDDRPDKASLRAILYGPYLLAFHSGGDWDVKVGSKALTDWLIPIPASNRSHLISFSQEFGNSNLVLTHANLDGNQSFTMENIPDPSSDAALKATYRLVLLDQSPLTSWQDALHRNFMIEAYNRPGWHLMHQGPEAPFLMVLSPLGQSTSVFRVVPGLDGRNDTISVEADSNRGCYLYSGVNYLAGAAVKLSCKSQSSDSAFNQAASFIAGKGTVEYHPVSFVAKPENREYLVEPLLAYGDAPYTVYVNFQ